MHNYTLHDTLHQKYVFLFETGIQSGERVFHPIKASERLSRRKKNNSNRSEFSKNFKSQSDWHQSCKCNQVDIYDKVEVQPNWQSRVSPSK